MDTRTTEEKITEERFDAKSRVDGARIASQFGRLKNGHKSRHAEGGSAERDAERRLDARDRARSRKANARYQRRVRVQQTALADLQAQIRVAAGQTGASEAMVRNAQRALERRVADVMKANPQLTEEQAVEAIYDYARGAL